MGQQKSRILQAEPGAPWEKVISRVALFWGKVFGLHASNPALCTPTSTPHHPDLVL